MKKYYFNRELMVVRGVPGFPVEEEK